MSGTVSSGIVSLEALEAVGGALPKPSQPAAAAKNESAAVTAVAPAAITLTRQQRRKYERLVKRHKRWLDTRQVAYREIEKVDEAGIAFTLIELAVCPIKPDGHDNRDGGPWIRIHPTQGVHGGCHHDKTCKGKHLNDLLTAIDPSFAEAAHEEALKELLGSAQDKITNPHPLAARLIAKYRHKERPTICRVGEVLFVWANGVWTELAEVDALAEITRICRRAFIKWAKLLKSWGVEVKTSPVTNALAKNVLSVILSLVDPVSGDAPIWIDGSGPDTRNIIALENGWLDLNNLGGHLVVHHPTPLLFNLSKLPFRYDPTAPEPTLFLQFLDSIWPDDAEAKRLLQQWFGYCLVDDTSFLKYLLLTGASRGGKGTICRLLIKLVGKHNAAATDFDDLARQFGKENLPGKRLLIPPDAMKPSDIFAKKTTTIIKVLTGGDDLINIQRKGKPSLDMALRVKVVIPTNDLIDLPDSSAALYNRLLALPFRKSFLGEAADRDLDAKLERELPGIFLWALEGLKDLRQQGHFTEPASAKSVKDAIRETGSPMPMFIDDCCDRKHGAFALMDDLYGAYEVWCFQSDIPAVGRDRFRNAFQEAAPWAEYKRRGPRGDQKRGFTGVLLKPDLPPYAKRPPTLAERALLQPAGA